MSLTRIEDVVTQLSRFIIVPDERVVWIDIIRLKLACGKESYPGCQLLAI
jgi:hypothetical protein